MNNDKATSKDFNIEEVNQIKTTTIEIVKISSNLEMIKDNTGIIYDLGSLHFIVPKGGNVRRALRDAMEYLQTQKDQICAVLKYKEFEVSFRRDEKFADVLGYVYAVEEFIKIQAISPLQQ